MRINEEKFRRVIREEARRTRLFEIQNDGYTPVTPAAGAALTAPSAPSASTALNDTDKQRLNKLLNELGMQPLDFERLNMAILQQTYNQFINNGIFLVDIWTGPGELPADYKNEESYPGAAQAFQNLFMSKWNSGQVFATGELLRLVRGSRILDPGSFNYSRLIGGQWDDSEATILERVHNMLVRLKIPLGAATPTSAQASDAAGAPTGTRQPIKVGDNVGNLKKIQQIIGAAQTGNWDSGNNERLQSYLGTKRTQITGTSVQSISADWKRYSPGITAVNGKPASFKPTLSGLLEFLYFVDENPPPATNEGSWRRGDILNESKGRVKIAWGR